MANQYPAAPSYGSYAPATYYPAQFQQLPPATVNPSPIVSQSNSQQPHAPAPYYNAPRFEANAQVALPNPFPQLPPGAFTPELFRQFAVSNLPPPPPPSFYRPPPLPNVSFLNSQPASSTQGEHAQNIVNFNSGPSSTSISANQAQEFLQASAGGNDEVVDSAGEGPGSMSEEGELSDGELEGSPSTSENRFSQAVSQEDPRIQPRTIREGSSTNQAKLIQGDLTMGNMFQTEHSTAEDGNLSDGEESASSYNPPSASTPDFEPDEVSDLPQPIFVGEEDPFNPEASADTILIGGKYSDKSSVQLRELAKGALLSLAPHNIKYPELLKEGIDPAILEQLYKELGIKDGRTGLEPKSFLPDVKSLAGQQPKLSADSQSKDFLQSANQDIALNASNKESLPTTLAPQTYQSSSLNDAKADAPTQPTISPMLERKDRIAQLLAAKTGKLPPNRVTPERPSPTLATKSAIPAPAGTPISTSLTTTESIPNRLASTPVGLAEQKSVKSRAQTELVRQKMEALKKESMAKATARTTEAGSVLSATPVIPVTNNGEESVPGTIIINKPVASALTSSQTQLGSSSHALNPLAGSSAASTSWTDQSYASFIPGLFMTSEESPTVEQVESIQPTNLSSQILPEGLSAKIPAPSLHPNEELPIDPRPVQPSSFHAGNDTPVQGKAKARLGQKRPLASDSFDEITEPSPKRTSTRKELTTFTELEKTHNDDYEASEGEIMELDNESQASQSPKPTSLNQGEEPASSQYLVHTLDADEESSTVEVPVLTTIESGSTTTQPKDNVAVDRWRAKHQEIEVMRKRIADLEEKQKLKRSQSQLQSPQPTTPNTATIQAPLSIPTSPVLTTKSFNIPASGINGQSAATSSSHANQPSFPESSVGSDPIAARAAALKAEVLRQRLLRRKTLQEGLPDLDAEVQKTQSKLAEAQQRLAQIREERERREAEIRAARQQEQDLLEEARNLELQLLEGLSGRKQFSEELQTLSGESEMTGVETSVQSPSLANNHFEPDSQHLNSLPANTVPPQQEYFNDSSIPVLSSTSRATSEYRDSQGVDDLDTAGQSPSHESETAIGSNAIDMGHESDYAPEIQKANSDVISAVVLQSPRNLSEVDSSYGNEVRPEGSPSESMIEEEADDVEMIIDSYEESDESVSMSDGGSEDYEPADPDDGDQIDAGDESDEYEPGEPGEPSPETQQQLGDHEDEDYEPAEIVDAFENIPTPVEVLTPIEPTISASGTISQIDGREGGLQLTEADTLIKPQEMPQLIDNVVSTTAKMELSEPQYHFTRYQSPLKSLKSFRFNPNYNDLVKEGYRSLTYSHNIDSKRPICPTELAGEVCTDPTCEEQHFGQMTLADAKILEQLAAAPDLTDREQRDRFLVGLKGVITDLRTRGVKEFKAVADELAAYRRLFRETEDPALKAPDSPASTS